MQTWKGLTAAAALVLAVPAPLLAQVSDTARDTGVSAIWILANISFAGMRAQAHPSVGWRIVAFLFGFPGTLVSFLAIRERRRPRVRGRASPALRSRSAGTSGAASGGPAQVGLRVRTHRNVESHPSSSACPMADCEFDPNVEVDQLRHDIRIAEAQLDAGEGVEHTAAREHVRARLRG